MRNAKGQSYNIEHFRVQSSLAHQLCDDDGNKIDENHMNTDHEGKSICHRYSPTMQNLSIEYSYLIF